MRSKALGLGAVAMGLAMTLAGGALAQGPAGASLALHDALLLSPDQEAAWRTYAAALEPSPDLVARHRATDMLLPQLATPRRIALIEATMAADDADWRRQGQAVNVFYAGLRPDQQRIFDRETAQPAQPAQSGQRP